MPDASLLAPECLIRFKQVDINGWGGIRLKDGTTIHSPWLGARANAFDFESQQKKLGQVRQKSVSMATGAAGFGHWFLHRLSRLASIKRAAPSREIISTKLHWNPAFMWEGFGLDPKKAMYLPKDKVGYYEARDLLVPTYSTPMSYPRVTDSRRMRQDVSELTMGIGGFRGDGYGPRKLFLLRDNATSTRVGVSEPALLQDAFERRGFVSVDLSKIKFQEQVRMVRSASVIAGEVGSFSMNAIFAQPGLGVITVAARNRLNNLRYVVGMKTFTRTVTDAFQHHQRRVVASETHRTAPWHVDFQALNEALDSMPEIPDLH
jgi:capsular polysaccharide biosynthesis protein